MMYRMKHGAITTNGDNDPGFSPSVYVQQLTFVAQPLYYWVNIFYGE